MSDATPHLSCYLVEWYRAEPWQDASVDDTVSELRRAAEVMTRHGISAEVLMALSVPTDDVIFCIFVASSPDVVVQICDYAGIPAERVTAATAIAAA
jgi:hypothetical protein